MHFRGSLPRPRIFPFLLLVLIVNLLVALVGCGGGGSSPANSGTGSGSGSNSQSQSSSPSSQMGTTAANLQNTTWGQYSLLPPNYLICKTCTPDGPQLVLWNKQGVSSPSLSGSAMETYTAGTLPFSDGFWNNRIVGDGASNPDSSHTLNPTLHHFVYDVYLYIQDPSVSQALEFDINQFVNGRSLIWGHECRIAGGHQWDIWNNTAQHWLPTGIPCNPVANSWNHVVIEVERTSDDNLHFISITLNGNKTMTDHYDTSTPTSWYGVTINYQQDGDYAQHAYSVWLDKVNFTYW